jgi:hypothetical protein
MQPRALIYCEQCYVLLFVTVAVPAINSFVRIVHHHRINEDRHNERTSWPRNLPTDIPAHHDHQSSKNTSFIWQRWKCYSCLPIVSDHGVTMYIVVTPPPPRRTDSPRNASSHQGASQANALLRLEGSPRAGGSKENSCPDVIPHDLAWPPRSVCVRGRPCGRP